MKLFLNKSIHSFSSPKEKWLFIGFISGFTTLFLLIFQPFGVNNFDPTHSIDATFFFSMIGFGFVIAAALALCEFVINPLIFKKNIASVFIVKIMFELVLVATAVFLYYNILGDFHDWRLRSYVDFVFNISVMSIIPISIMLLFYNNKRTKQEYQLLELRPKLALTEKYINLKSSNDKESITLTLDNLLYIEAQDNYVSVYYLENDTLKSKLLRTTMKEVEENLKSEFVLRCHRSFIVNLNKVEKVLKENHQLKLFIPGLELPIITSRSFISQISSILYTRHK